MSSTSARAASRAGLEREVVAQVRRLSEASARLSHAFADQHELHPTDFRALLVVHEAEARGEPLTVGALGEALELSSGAMTYVVNRLERAGHLVRQRSETDRRRVILRYAEHGQAVAAAFFGPLGARTAPLLATRSEAELETIRAFLADIADQLAAHADELDLPPA